jgi:hypothetical protein
MIHAMAATIHKNPITEAPPFPKYVYQIPVDSDCEE